MKKINFLEKVIIYNPVNSALVVFVILTTVVVILTSGWDFFSGVILPNTQLGLYSKAFWENVLVEAHGMILDLSAVGVIIIYLDHRRGRKENIDKYQEDIDDFRYWVANEAKFKIVGNIKRLNSLGVSEINLSDCFLAETNLSGLNLQGANLRGANLGTANLRKSILANAKLEGCVLAGASLRGCNLSSCNIERSNSREANFSGAILKDVKMWRSDFTGVIARSADFRSADLKEVNFKDADLRSANFLGARNLTVDQLLEAGSIKDVKLDRCLQDAIIRSGPVGGI